MSDGMAFTAQSRDRAGKGAARATRRQGRVPGIIYGDKQDPVLISLDAIELMKQLNMTGFFARVYEIDVAATR